MDELDWNLVRAFQATVDTGSLTAAARAIGVSQPTVSRQVAALEAALGVTLFERVGRRLELTEPGHALARHAAAMREAAAALALEATGRSESIEGTVTISASDAVAMYLLPPIVGRIRAEAPGITVRILVDNALSDLRRREADIAVRHVRPADDELFGKRVRDANAAFYASRAWIGTHGHPRCGADLPPAAFIGAGDAERHAEHLRGMGLQVDPSDFRVVCDDSLVAWELAGHGLGISAIMCELADRMPQMVRVLDDVPLITFPIWLVTHREVHTAKRIRLVFDMLAEGLAGEPRGR